VRALYWKLIRRLMIRLESHYTEHVVADWYRNPPANKKPSCDHWCTGCGCVCSHCGRAE
jgi:hypothetical protein